MQTPPFPDPHSPPNEDELVVVIGKDLRMVTAVMDRLRKDHRTITHAYKFSKTSGWHLTYDKGKQRLCYLFPKRGDFLLKVVFNDKGVAALAKTDLGPSVEEKLRHAKKYAEGTLLEFTAAEITAKVLKELLRIKIASVI